MSLRRAIASKIAEGSGLEVSWDDCIDLFIQSQNNGDNSSSVQSSSGRGSTTKGLGGSTVNFQTPPPGSNPTMNSHQKNLKMHITTDHEDLVNMSEGKNRQNFDAVLLKEVEQSKQ